MLKKLLFIKLFLSIDKDFFLYSTSFSLRLAKSNLKILILENIVNKKADNKIND